MNRLERLREVPDAAWKAAPSRLHAAVLRRFLRQEGIDTVIVFGVRMEGPRTVEAHAWLERSGQPFAEAAETAAYRRGFEFPAGG